MAKNLLIVESPAKSATIMKFLGSDFEVKASFWHVVDLPKKELGVDVTHNFAPKYEVSPEKTKVVAELKALAKKADKVWIATDEDREGEAIGRHVANQLWLDIKKTSRIVFHEITKTALEHAVKNPRTLDMNLVDAQQARRVLDRLVGFELSPVLRQKIGRGLSAWRVQSVAVKLLVQREREIQSFESNFSFKVIGDFLNNKKQTFKAELSKKIASEKDAQKVLEEIKNGPFVVADVETKPGKRSPSAPFTTSTLQQEASRKFGMPVARTMQIAQKLYEGGHITYMRTDSLNMSDAAINAAQAEITKLYGKEYAKPTVYKSKSKGAQEAHECIRPTHMEKRNVGDDAQQQKLYELIRKRTIASQMAPAELEKTKVTIDVQKTKHQFIAQGEVIKFDGFLKVYFESKDDEDDENTEGILPPLKKWEEVSYNQIIATQTFDKHPPRYTEASLVKKLEELGIWRPSTYAPTISTVQKRGYAVLEDRDGVQRSYNIFTLKAGNIKQETKQQNTWAEKKKLFPTDMGMVVTDFLDQHFGDIMDYNFTAKVEEEFDIIAEGKLPWTKMIGQFYGPFHKGIEKISLVKERVNTERALGKDPISGKPIIARMGRFGPMLQIGAQNEKDGSPAKEKPKYANIPAGKNIETITLEEALQAFTLPRNLWKYKGDEVSANIGRFWPYVKYKTLFVSIPKDSWLDPFTITLDDAVPLIEKKIEFEANKNINSFPHDGDTIYVLNGRYWAYIMFKKTNYRIPKNIWKDATDLTKDDCVMIISGKKDSSISVQKSTTKSEKKTPTKKSPAKKIATKKSAKK